MMEQHQPLLERSQKLLADRFSQDVTLTITAEIPGNFFVLRCQLTPVLTGLSPSVIVKQTPMDDETTREGDACYEEYRGCVDRVSERGYALFAR
jgi:hypothetical protein